MSLAAILSTAIASHQAGKLKEAEGLYRQILAAEPEHSDALHLMGLLASQVGQFETAEKLMRRAIAGNSRAPIYHNNLGTVMRQMETAAKRKPATAARSL